MAPGRPLSVVHIAAEHSELLYSGGLGQVVSGISRAQAAHGAHVTVMLPGYADALTKLDTAELGHADVMMPWGPARFTEYGATRDDVALRLLYEPAFFGRPGLYADPSGAPYSDDPPRFVAFARAAALLAAGADVVHLHDWHAGMAAPHLTRWWHGPGPRPAVVMTVHNLAFQGAFPRSALGLTGLGMDACGVDGIEHWGRINPLKAGLQFADKLTTVSPTYADELLTDDLGWDLAGLFRHRRDDLVGILNGLTDPPPVPTAPRAERRAALCAEVGLKLPATSPLFAIVSRLTRQKGIDLVADAWPELPGDPALLVLGTGDADLMGALRKLSSARPHRVVFVDEFDPALAQRIFFGADAVLVPSRFEPCGLTQLHGMRGGALPIARSTGGLSDTVVDIDDEGWGFVFEDATPEALGGCLARAIERFETPRVWEAARKRGQQWPFGWDVPAQQYLDLYAAIDA